MNPLRQSIIKKITSQGPMSFEAFMESALYHPEYGYYTKNSAGIGKTGDFYTSSHLHPVFGAMLGRQMYEMWETMGLPENFKIVEMGAGMGYLAQDIMEYLKGFTGARGHGGKGKEDFYKSFRYTIVEISPHLKAKQQELLKDFSGMVNWVSDLSELKTFTGCFLSNELLDAFPVRLVEMDKELMEIYISASGDNFTEVKMPCSDEVRKYFKEFSIKLPTGCRTEVNLKIHDWLKNISGKLKEGFLLTIDYGYTAEDYYSEERNRGTLLCYHRHKANEDPYKNIGEQDITAHVNFSALEKWGEGFGLKTLGFCPQGTFLIALGIDEVIEKQIPALDALKIKGLILPGAMGESHKVMIQYKGSGEPELRGFSIRNQKGLL